MTLLTAKFIQKRRTNPSPCISKLLIVKPLHIVNASLAIVIAKPGRSSGWILSSVKTPCVNARCPACSEPTCRSTEHPLVRCCYTSGELPTRIALLRILCILPFGSQISRASLCGAVWVFFEKGLRFDHRIGRYKLIYRR